MIQPAASRKRFNPGIPADETIFTIIKSRSQTMLNKGRLNRLSRRLA
jgi:hypothetical protein